MHARTHTQRIVWCIVGTNAEHKQSLTTGVYIGNVAYKIQQHVIFCQQTNLCVTVRVKVTTHSKLLMEQERLDLCQHLPVCAITLLSLQAFDTEQQFCQQLRSERESVCVCVCE